MAKQRWNSVTVIGCGLIGASFALALKRAGACARVAGWDCSADALAEALRRGVIDEVDCSFAAGEISAADLVYLAMPVPEIISFLRVRGAQLKPGAVLTDAGSTKAEICRAARLSLPAGRHFIGGHPVAGSQRQGLAHARADLFKDASYVLVPDADEGEESAALASLKETLILLGARVRLMNADEHDGAMALVSHLPQLVSSALAAVVNERPDAPALVDLSGAGYRDMTRLAASSWSMWRGILETNPAHIAFALEMLCDKLSGVRDELRGVQARDPCELKMTGKLFAHPRPASKPGIQNR